MNCRSCASENLSTFLDLGDSPPSNSFVSAFDLNKIEKSYPLRTVVCESCYLVQTEDFVAPTDIFTPDYAYFSSFSSTWIEHAKQFVLQMIKKLNLKKDSFVVEVASNDGYLLQFMTLHDIPCLGVEPASETANVAVGKGINVINDFFTVELAQKIVGDYKKADLVIANNVLAHVPDPEQMLRGIHSLLSDNGVASIEFQSLKDLIEKLAIDTIYHEHFSYYSLTSFKKIAEFSGLKVIDVEKISTHGGSLRVYTSLSDSSNPISTRVQSILMEEERYGLKDIHTYRTFCDSVTGIKDIFVDFLLAAKSEGFKIAGYGAAAKASTLINYAGVKADLITMIADKNPAKIGRYMPSSLIPIVDVEELVNFDPDYVLIFAWNIKDEILLELAPKLSKKTKFFQLIPKIIIIE